MLNNPSHNRGVRAKAQDDAIAIYREIREAIVKGSLPAGSRLPTERELALRFGAARNTVRKTMGRLAEEGLIVRHVGRGTFVSDNGKVVQPPASEFSLGELLEARLLFEPYLVDLVVERATSADYEAMQKSLDAMRVASSWAEFKEAKYALHLAIARASQNRFVIAMFEQILASRRRTGWSRPGGHSNLLSAVREAAYLENVDIVDALRSHDGDGARAAIRNYLMRTLAAAGST